MERTRDVGALMLRLRFSSHLSDLFARSQSVALGKRCDGFPPSLPGLVRSSTPGSGWRRDWAFAAASARCNDGSRMSRGQGSPLLAGVLRRARIRTPGGETRFYDCHCRCGVFVSKIRHAFASCAAVDIVCGRLYSAALHLIRL